MGCFDSEDSGRVRVTVVGLVDNEIPSSGLTMEFWEKVTNFSLKLKTYAYDTT